MLRLGKRSKELTDKQMRVVRRKHIFMKDQFFFGGAGLPYLHGYTGCSGDMGSCSTTNTLFTISQLTFALAANFHPNITKLIKALKKLEEDEYHPEIEKLLEELLINEKVFEGIKVLDLGCGWRPPFGRVLRAMGAEVWTVDLNSADVFEVEFHNGGFDQRARDLEVANHIQCDLSFRESAELILTRTGGNFDLVTSAHLSSDGDFYNKGPLIYVDYIGLLVPRILRKYGIYFEEPGNSPIVYLGDKKVLRGYWCSVEPYEKAYESEF